MTRHGNTCMIMRTRIMRTVSNTMQSKSWRVCVEHRWPCVRLAGYTMYRLMCMYDTIRCVLWRIARLRTRVSTWMDGRLKRAGVWNLNSLPLSYSTWKHRANTQFIHVSKWQIHMSGHVCGSSRRMTYHLESVHWHWRDLASSYSFPVHTPEISL